MIQESTSLKNEPVSVEIESCAPCYEQGTPVGLFIIRSPYDNVGLVISVLNSGGTTVFIPHTELIKWFLQSHLPHKTVNLLLTMITMSNSKQPVDDFVGEVTLEKPFNELLSETSVHDRARASSGGLPASVPRKSPQGQVGRKEGRLTKETWNHS